MKALVPRPAPDAGIKGTLTNVDAVVTATDSARSALHNEHHNPENPPDGDAVTSSSVIRVTLENGAARNARYLRGRPPSRAHGRAWTNISYQVSSRSRRPRNGMTR